jgi:hypothetical protein
MFFEDNQFGAPYPKIQTVFKRDARNIIIPGDWSIPEFAYLSDCDWAWTEKVDGMNIRVHWNGMRVTFGGRTDNAQIPATLVDALQPLRDMLLWRSVFPDADDVTLYGEGYGAKIQRGGQYRPDQALIVFDVKVGKWWLRDDDVLDVAGKLGLETVPKMPVATLKVAVSLVRDEAIRSKWDGAQIEGLVGRPCADLYDRHGSPLLAKVKVKDFRDLQKRGG